MPQDLISQFDRKYPLPIETYRQVQNITQRNAIPADIRWEGMMCYVLSEGLSYVLTAGMENSDWVEFGALVDVIVVDNLLSTSPTDALSANQGRVLLSLIDGGGAVDSVFGRTGAVVAQTGDYTFAQIGSKPTTIGGYGITDFNSLGDVRWLGISAKAADSNLLDGLDSSAFQTRNEKGAANGYTPLDSGAKVPIAYLPDSVIGQVQYQGTWAASTNTPTLANPPSAATKGHYYVASDNGTQFGIPFQTGDWIISNGTAWEKVDNTDAVTSVFGRLGAIVANAGDYTFAQIGAKPTTLAGYGIQGDADARYVNVTGDTMTGNLSAPGVIGTGLSGNAVRIYGQGTGANNLAYFSIYESNGSTRQAYFGFPTTVNSDLYIQSDVTSSFLALLGTGGANSLVFNYGSGSKKVWHSGNMGAGSGLDADLFEGLEGTAWIRSNTNSTKTSGFTRYNDNNELQFGTGNDSHIFHSGIHSYWDLNNGNLLIRDGSTDRFIFERTTGNLTATGTMTATNFIGNWNGLQVGNFIRANANSTKTSGYTRYNDQLEVQFGTGNDARLQHDGGQMNLDMTTGGFHIRGTGAIDAWIAEQNGNTVQFGTATATNFILSSDRRLKKDIEDYTPTHIPIRWREFTWKESGERQIGTIAQETPKQFVTKGADGKLAVKTIEMLMAKVAELESRIINLEI